MRESREGNGNGVEVWISYILSGAKRKRDRGVNLFKTGTMLEWIDGERPGADVVKEPQRGAEVG